MNYLRITKKQQFETAALMFVLVSTAIDLKFIPYQA